ncbi:MAG: hypothetical protein ACJ789_18665 [Thermomicrobiales bacterium]
MSLRVWLNFARLFVTIYLFASLASIGTPEVAANQATPAVASPQPTSEHGASGGETNGPLKVTIGFYLAEVHGLDQQESTFFADFYMWMRWKGNNDPTPTVELLNNVARWALTMKQIYATPVSLPSGERLQQFHIQGQFYEPLLLQDYPLDKHVLRIDIEDSTYPIDQLIYVPDTDQTSISADIRIPGWQVTSWSLTAHEHDYSTDFGFPSTTGQHNYSLAELDLKIKRPESFFRWKLLLPLLIVLLLGCSVLLVHPAYPEVRLAGPATALLTLVFLQQAYTNTLPEVGTLVLLDKIYVLAYIVVVGLIATTILTSHWIHVDEANATRAQRLDRIAAIGLLGLFLVGMVTLLITAA